LLWKIICKKLLQLFLNYFVQNIFQTNFVSNTHKLNNLVKNSYLQMNDLWIETLKNKQKKKITNSYNNFSKNPQIYMEGEISM